MKATTKEKIENILNGNFGKAVEKFATSIVYPFAIALACIISHSFSIAIVGFGLIFLLAAFALVFCKNTITFAPLIMMVSFVLSPNTISLEYFIAPFRLVPLIFIVLILIAAFVFHMSYYKKWKTLFTGKRALSFSIILCNMILVVGGIFSPTYTPGAPGNAIALCACMLIPYLLILNGGKYEGKKTFDYIGATLIACVFIIAVATLEEYVKWDYDIHFNDKYAGAFQYGFGIGNSISSMLLFTIPFTFYYAYKSKRGFLFLLLALGETMLTFANICRAAIVVAFPAFIILAIVIAVKKKKDSGKLWYLITLGVIIVAAAVILGIFHDWTKYTIKALIAGPASGDVTTGRGEIWTRGFEAWKDHPIFGIGLNYLLKIGYNYNSFHCTPLTYMYCGGLIGLVGYVYHRYKTVKVFVGAKITFERVTIGLAILLFLLNSLLDMGMSSPERMFFYSVLLALMEGEMNYTKEQAAQKTESLAAGETVMEATKE